MPDIPLNLAEIEERIAAVRENLTELEEQAAAYSDGAVEELNAQRIADQEAQLELLTRQRDDLLQRKPRPELRLSIKQERYCLSRKASIKANLRELFFLAGHRLCRCSVSRRGTVRRSLGKNGTRNSPEEKP